MREATCASCYWYSRNDESDGECRFNAPVLLDGERMFGSFPMVESTDFCGEHLDRGFGALMLDEVKR